MRSEGAALLQTAIRGVYGDVSTDRRRSSLGHAPVGDAGVEFSIRTFGSCGIVVDDPVRFFLGGEVRAVGISRASGLAVALATVGLQGDHPAIRGALAAPVAAVGQLAPLRVWETQDALARRPGLSLHSQKR